LKDIAQIAGVSVSTVSRVINNDKVKPASKKTAEKVWKIARELGYVKNINAINPNNIYDATTNRSIGCIYTSTKDGMSDPFFSRVGTGIKEALNETGYSLGFALSIYEKPFEDMTNYLANHPVNGIIVMGRFKRQTLDYLKDNCENLVYAGVNYVDAGFDEVICDGYKGAIAMVNYLINKGHKKIGYIGDGIHISPDSIINEHRYEGYKDAMTLAGLELNEEFTIHTKPYMLLAYEATKEYLKNNKTNLPTAFFCTNDLTAIGAMKAFREAGIDIPSDISIVGFDDVETSQYVSPTLTTISVPKEELGKMAVEIMLEKLEKNRNYNIRVDIPYELIERESCINI